MRATFLARCKELDELLIKLNENVAEIRKINEESERLKKQNDVSFERMKRAVNSLSKY